MAANPNPDCQAGYLQFWGTPAADLFTRELAVSFQGVLNRNRISDPDDAMRGFISASIEGRSWTGTWWTRDAAEKSFLVEPPSYIGWGGNR